MYYELILLICFIVLSKKIGFLTTTFFIGVIFLIAGIYNNNLFGMKMGLELSGSIFLVFMLSLDTIKDRRKRQNEK